MEKQTENQKPDLSVAKLAAKNDFKGANGSVVRDAHQQNHL